MTRFTIVGDDDNFRMILDKETGKKIGFNSQVVGLLNTLHQENQSLKEKRFNPSNFECKEEVWDLLEKQAVIIEDLMGEKYKIKLVKIVK